MLPRFNSRENESLLPRFGDNQSVQTKKKTYDQSGNNCWPLINTNIVNFDLERTYEIVSNSLESYVNYRKLNRCKALANFIDYRDKIYKREKQIQLIQAIPSQEQAVLTKHRRNSPADTSEISPMPPLEESTDSEQPSLINEQPSSTETTEEAIIPIPSPNLLEKKSSLKQKRSTAPMKTKMRPVNKGQ